MDSVVDLDSQDCEDSISKKNYRNPNKYNMEDDHESTCSYHENSNEDADSIQDDSDYYDSDQFMYDDDDDDDNNNYRILQAQLDNDRIPPGIETTVPNLEYTLPSRVVMRQHFERFDIVDEFPDHYFKNIMVNKPSRKWIKRIQEEWKILSNLPDTIYVIACETRMELLQAVIVGPAGTPYHDGLFIFDIGFPFSYPDAPPMVYYHSGGIRLNPNLYGTGKVCLSLLNTWKGNKNEKWRPEDSTVLQLLVSIQALILNSEPMFNEPGFSEICIGEDLKRRSKKYNENAFILSLKTMGYTLNNPPKHFEELIRWHFCVRAHDILSACKSYIEEGTQVGAIIKGNNDSVQRFGPSLSFVITLCQMMDDLVARFIMIGADDCKIFRFVTWQPQPLNTETERNS